MVKGQFWASGSIGHLMSDKDNTSSINPGSIKLTRCRSGSAFKHMHYETNQLINKQIEIAQEEDTTGENLVDGYKGSLGEFDGYTKDDEAEMKIA